MNEKNIITCPQCKQRLRIPSHSGKIKIKCPKCNFQFYCDENLSVYILDEKKQNPKSSSKNRKYINIIFGLAMVLIIVAYVVIFLPKENIQSTKLKPKKWITIEYQNLLDNSQIIRTGELLILAVQDPYLRGAVQPFVDNYSFLLPHVINMINGQDSIPQQTVIDNFPIGSRQPAWVAIFRGGRILITSDYSQLTRIFLIGEDPKTAYDKNYSIIRHCLTALLPDNDTEMAFEVYAYKNIYEKSQLMLCLDAYKFNSSRFFAPFKIIPLDLEGLSDFFQNGGKLEGVKLDRKKGLILFAKESGTETLAGHKIELSDLAVAYRAVFHAGDNEAFISLDPHKDATKVTVNFGGFLEDTRMGYVVLQSDKRFKSISSGLDITKHNDIREFTRKYVPTFLSGYERNFCDGDESLKSEWIGTRLWFYPDSVEILSDPYFEHAVIVKPQFTADAERSRDDFLSLEEFNEKKDILLSLSTRECIDHMNQNYEQYAEAFSEIKELTTVARLMGLCSWLKSAKCGWLDLDSLLSVELSPFWTERENTKMLSVSYLYYISGKSLDENFIKKNSKVLFLSPILDETVVNYFGNKTKLAKFMGIINGNAEKSFIYELEAEELFSSHKNNKVREIIETEDDLKALVSYATEQINPRIPEEIVMLNNNINYYRRELDRIENEINDLETKIDKTTKRPKYNSLVRQYNQLVDQYKSFQTKHNQIVDSYNKLKTDGSTFMRISGGINLESKHFKIRQVSDHPQLRQFKYIGENATENWKNYEGSGKWIRSRTNYGKAIKNYLPRIVWEIKDKFSTNGSSCVNLSASKNRNFWMYKNISEGSWKDKYQGTRENYIERKYNNSLKVLELVEFESGEIQNNITGRMFGDSRIVFSKSDKKDIQIQQDKPDWWEKK